MTAKLNRVVRCTAAVLAAAAIGAGATACDSSGDSSSKAAGSHSDAALNLSSSGQRDGGQDKAGTDAGSGSDKAGTDTGSGSDEAGTDAKSGSGASGSGQTGARDSSGAGARTQTTAQQGSRTDAVNPVSATSTTSRCHTGDLRYTWGGPHGGRPDMDTTDQQQVSIRLTNKSTRTCTLRGFPGVRLVSTTGEAWDLQRSGVTPSTMTLKPGDDTAMVSMSILPVQKNDPDVRPFVPAKILLTPPNETTHVTLKWPYGGAILDQSGATHPGTFVDPIVIG